MVVVEGMTDPERVVRAFFDAWEAQGFAPAFMRYMHADAVWQNAGFPDAVGRGAYMELLRRYLEFSGMPFGRVELTNIAVNGNVVLTERVDNLFNAAGDSTHPAPIMGTFVVEDGLITRYSDYFDPRPFFEMMERKQKTKAGKGQQ
jgi:limonene-1,2-epoxide hydrolase